MQAKSEEVKTPSSPSTFDYRFKVLMMGDSAADKFGIMKRYVDTGFQSQSQTTSLGLDYMVKRLECEEKTVRLELWDTAGQEMLDPERTGTTYYRNADGICLVYDVMSRPSMTFIERWSKHIQKHAPKHIKWMLIGHDKTGLKEREVNYDEASQFASSMGISYFEVCAKDNLNIDEVFYELTVQIKKAKDEDAAAEKNLFKNEPLPQKQKNSTEGGKSCVIF